MRSRRRRVPALLLLAVLTGAGCGAAPPTMGPQGVDEMVIPTPSPEPADFVEQVDNPWLPLRPGAVEEFAVTGDEPVVGLVVRTGGSRQIAGVPVTARIQEEYDAAGELVRERTDWLAQDLDGNVWLFGQDVRDPEPGGPELVDTGGWEAGRDGAEAGLAMPARPRLGDGYRVGSAPGVFDLIATVIAVDPLEGTAEVPLDGSTGTDQPLLEVRYRSELDPAADRVASYAAGTGLLHEVGERPGGRSVVRADGQGSPG